ncbi:MAG: type II toxin-antitoxin system VapC family toxin [Gemmatimonadota bacterium]|nr:type II toxin-antitoxin system VapC family toxin [Gemmatimonadota bacterium]
MPYTFDTNVAIHALRDLSERDRFQGFLRGRRGQVVLHATVWLELQVGARSAREQTALDDFVRPFVERHRLLLPSGVARQQAGRVLARLAREGSDTRRSSIHYDAIIAASAREARVTLVTWNIADFDRIVPHLGKFAYASPYP